MQCLEPGHIYLLETYDQQDLDPPYQRLMFMKRIGERYPGNVGATHSGTNCQEVLRILIDRFIYLNNQIPCKETTNCIWMARNMIYELEARACRVKGRMLLGYTADMAIETISTCEICGHIYCLGDHTIHNNLGG